MNIQTRKSKRQHTTPEEVECNSPRKKPPLKVVQKKIEPPVPTTENNKQNLYHAARKCLSYNFVTNLPGREKEIAKLYDYLKEILDKKGSGSFYISGPPGKCFSFYYTLPIFLTPNIFRNRQNSLPYQYHSK
jgi:hypothetical protein